MFINAMSSKKFKKMHNNLNNPIIKRSLIAFGFTGLSEVAVLFGISSQNLNGYIKRNTYLRLIEPELIKRNLNIEWIKTGQGEMRVSPTTTESDKWKDKYYELLEKHHSVMEELIHLKEPWSGKERRLANPLSFHEPDCYTSDNDKDVNR